MKEAQNNLSLETKISLSKIRSEDIKGIKNPQWGLPGFNTGVKFSNSHKQKISSGLKKYRRTSEHSKNLLKGHNKYKILVIYTNNTEDIFETLDEASKKNRN